jgi:antitoxin component YwqK of YwqJK toxin-antitoxin module
MKLLHVTFLFVFLLLFSCGDSSVDKTLSDADQAGENSDSVSKITSADAPTLPVRKISSQGWVGNTYDYKSDFLEVFENVEIQKIPPLGSGPEYRVIRDENDTGTEPVSKGRLRFKKDNLPFSGKIYRHFLSGEIEHFATYRDGFREGIAYWWVKDGNLTKISKGWGYDYEEVDLSKNIENPFMDMTMEMKRIHPNLAEPSVFIGTQKEWKEWSAVNSDKHTFSLSSGIHLTGKVKIYSDEGHLDLIKNYKDGLLDGEFATYHSNGVQAKSAQYKDGKKMGKEVWWSDNGFKSYSTNYLNDRVHGKTFTWDEKGYLISQFEFDNGKPIRPVSAETLPPAKAEQ